jgi:Mce-associated membrane protein
MRGPKPESEEVAPTEDPEPTSAEESAPVAQEAEPEAADTTEAEADTPEATDADTPEAATDADTPEAEAVPAEEQTAPQGRRWGLRRRRTRAAEEDSPEAAVADDEPEAEPVLVAHRPAGKRLTMAAAAAAVLFVAGGAFLGATAQPVIANRALVETKLDIARTAADAIATLWSYTPDNMDKLGERSARYLTGDFAFQYRKFIDSIVATNKQAQVTNTTTVLGAAVEAVDQSEASAIVYTNSVATSPVSKNIPSLRYLSYRLEMKRDRSQWRITRMTTVTTLDLTPQL